MKLLLFLLLIGGAIIGALLLFPPPTPLTPLTPPNPSNTLSQERNGIEVEIEQVDQRESGVTLTLALNNHQFDLSDDAIYEAATLDGALSLSHAFLSEASGGHHVEVEVVFPPTTRGAFTIAPTPDSVFTFDVLW